MALRDLDRGPAAVTSPPVASPTRVVWLEKFYDIVFVAVVGRFANELGTAPSLSNSLDVLGWLAGLWMTWLLVILRLNRFPDDRPTTRLVVVIQLMALCIAAAAAISVTTADDWRAVVGSAVLALTVAALYLGVLGSPVADPRLVAVPVVLSLVVAASSLASLWLGGGWLRLLPGLGTLLLFVVVLGWYLPRVAAGHPVDADKAGDRHAQLFLVLMGLSFLKVAFLADSSGAVAPPVVVGAFLTGFGLWSIYVDGVLPLGFPTRVSPQQAWLTSQLVLALGVTVAAAAAVALPTSLAGEVTTAQALLEGGSLATVMAALAVLALSSEHPVPLLAVVRTLAAAAFVVLTITALAGRAPASGAFSAAAACVVVVTAVAEVPVRRRGRPR